MQTARDVTEPNVRYAVQPQVAFYRVTLPALAANPGGSHAGQWQAVLALRSRAEIDKLLEEDRDIAAAFRAVGNSLPYSLIAHAYSNLQFEARLQQDSLRPGAIVILNASLKMYDIPFADDATVWAEVTRPDHTTTNLRTRSCRRGGLCRLLYCVVAGRLSMPRPRPRLFSIERQIYAREDPDRGDLLRQLWHDATGQRAVRPAPLPHFGKSADRAGGQKSWRNLASISRRW